METAISVNKHIFQLLNEDAQLKELVGNKIYPLVVKQNIDFPFIIFKKEGVNPIYSKDLLSYDTVIINVAIAAINYDDTVAIAERVRAVLENYRSTYFYNILLDNVSEDFIDDTFIQQLQFTAKIRVK
jgi:hypothetical protein